MTIDERLEALTHSVELIAQTQIKTEKEIRQLGRYVRVIVLEKHDCWSWKRPMAKMNHDHGLPH